MNIKAIHLDQLSFEIGKNGVTKISSNIDFVVENPYSKVPLVYKVYRGEKLWQDIPATICRVEYVTESEDEWDVS